MLKSEFAAILVTTCKLVNENEGIIIIASKLKQQYVRTTYF